MNKFVAPPLIILYVKDQEKSTVFYANILDIKPTLNVPGMTEFTIFENCKIGLMPENGIAKILGNKTPHPTIASGIPRCEIYLQVKNPKKYINRAIANGATLVNAFKPRNWGDKVAYFTDLDGHILAFAEKI